MQSLQNIFKDGNFHNLDDVLNMMYPGQDAKEWEQSHYAPDSTQDSTQESTPKTEKRTLRDVAKAPINISKNIDGNDIFIQVQAAGFEEGDISVNTKVDDDGYKLVIEGSVIKDSEEGFSYSTRQFTIEPFKSVIKITREIAEGNFNIDLGAGLLTIHCLPNMEANNIKKIF